MNAVAVFLFVIGLVGFALAQEPVILYGPYTYPLEFDGYTTGGGGTTAGGDETPVGNYAYITSTVQQNEVVYRSNFSQLTTEDLLQDFYFDWNGELTDVYITHRIPMSPNTELTHVDMRGITSFSGVDGAGQDFNINSSYPFTICKNNVLVSAAATRVLINIDPSNAYSEFDLETQSIP